MTGSITWEQIAYLIGVIGALGGLWWKLNRDLYELKIHIAENYVTKAGMSEQTDRLMRAIEGLGEKIDRTNERIDSALLPVISRPSR